MLLAVGRPTIVCCCFLCAGRALCFTHTIVCLAVPPLCRQGLGDSVRACVRGCPSPPPSAATSNVKRRGVSCTHKKGAALRAARTCAHAALARRSHAPPPLGKKKRRGAKQKKRPPSKALKNNDDDDDLKRNPDACVRAGRRDAQRSALFCVCVGCVPLNSCVHVWLDAPQRRRRISPALFGVCCPKPTGPPWGGTEEGEEAAHSRGEAKCQQGCDDGFGVK